MTSIDGCIDIASYDNRSHCYELVLSVNNETIYESVSRDNLEEFIEDFIAKNTSIREVYIRNKSKNYQRFKYPYSKVVGGYPFARITINRAELFKDKSGVIWYTEKEFKPLLSLCNSRLEKVFSDIIQ